MVTANVTEIITFTVSSKYKNERDRFEEVLQIFLTVKGFQRQQYGVTVEDPDIMKWLIDWDHYEDHAAFMKSEVYQPFLDEILPFMNGKPWIIHVPFKPFPPTAALSGPTVAITTYTPNADVNFDIFKEAFEGLYEAITVHPGCKGGSRGITLEEPPQAVIVSSWMSKEAYSDAMLQSPGYKHAWEGLGPMISKHSTYHVVS